jgi:hypothetical protein
LFVFVLCLVPNKRIVLFVFVLFLVPNSRFVLFVFLLCLIPNKLGTGHRTEDKKKQSGYLIQDIERRQTK